MGELSEYYGDKPIIRSLLQLVPGWSSADTLLQQRANEIRAERMRIFFDELASGKHELTSELIGTEDFLHCYFCTLKAALNTRQKEKIKMMARLLDASLSTDTDTSTEEYEELLVILDTISFREFSALLMLFRLEQSNLQQVDHRVGLYGVIKTYWATFKSTVITNLGVPEDLFPSFMAKIERTGLYLRIEGGPITNTGLMGRTTALFNRLLQFIDQK